MLSLFELPVTFIVVTASVAIILLLFSPIEINVFLNKLGCYSLKL